MGSREATLGGLAILAAAVTGWGLWSLDGIGVVPAAVLAVLAVSMVLMVGIVVSTSRRSAEALRTLSEALGSRFESQAAELQELRQRLSSLERISEAGLTRLEEHQRLLKENRSLLRENRAFLREQAHGLNHLPAEFDALLQVHRRLDLRDPLPLMGGWALSPTGILQAIDLIELDQPKLIVECGSGTSTLFMARALDMLGGDDRRLVSLEHLEQHAERTRESIDGHGLGHVAEVRYAPLAEVTLDGIAYTWYALEAIDDLHGIDLTVVDGPPRSTDAEARYPAYPLLRDRMTNGAAILVDDTRRKDERVLLERWLALGGLERHLAIGDDQTVLRLTESGGEGPRQTPMPEG